MQYYEYKYTNTTLRIRPEKRTLVLLCSAVLLATKSDEKKSKTAIKKPDRKNEK